MLCLNGGHAASWSSVSDTEQGAVPLLPEDDGSLTIFRLPRAYWHCQLGNFMWEWVRPASLQEHYMRFLGGIEAGLAPHLILSGDTGIGKTHLGVAAYRWAVRRVGTELATWVNVPEFCTSVKAAYTDENGHGPFEDYAAARRFVVLDDLLGRDLTLHEASQIVYRLLDVAYQNGAAVLITMNPAVTELVARFPPHEVSRILAAATIIPMQGSGDRRRP